MCRQVAEAADYNRSGSPKLEPPRYTPAVMTQGPFRRYAQSAALFACLCLAMPDGAVQAATDKAKAARELDAIQGRIRTLEKEISRAASAKPTAGNALRKAERAEADARTELRNIRRQLTEGRAHERRLRSQIAQAQADIDSHRTALEGQLRLAYVSGREEWLRLALGQQDPVALSRRLVYYGYITRQRSGLLEQVQQRIGELEAAAAELAEQLAVLASLDRKQEAHVQEVATARAVRARALQTLERDLGTRQQRLGRLKREARTVEQLMARLAREARARPRPATPPAPAPGPAQQVKDLPLRGRAVARFGQPRAEGLLRWDGMVLAAPAGTEVRAVRAGRVVYADWLPGMGQLVVVDHGRGLMSLYGHNQQLLKAAGQDVRQGEAIARVGDSGGQGTPGLYFEVRRNGKPINPKDWVR